jgi:hypothetical protein
MGLANDSVDVTPGSGATIATHLISSKEHEVWMAANKLGELYRAHSTYLAWLDAKQGLFADNEEAYWDIFNASGSGVRLRILRIVTRATDLGPNGSLGANICRYLRTTAAGAGGTTVTPNPLDDTASALPSQITMRVLPLTTQPTYGALLAQPHYRDTTVGFEVLGQYMDRLAPRCWRHQPIVVPEGEGIALAGGGAGFIQPMSMVLFTTEAT